MNLSDSFFLYLMIILLFIYSLTKLSRISGYSFISLNITRIQLYQRLGLNITRIQLYQLKYNKDTALSTPRLRYNKESSGKRSYTDHGLGSTETVLSLTYVLTI